jgi:hypothetical protein
MAAVRQAQAIFTVLVAYAGVDDTDEAMADFARFYEKRETFDHSSLRLPGFAGQIRYTRDSGWHLVSSQAGSPSDHEIKTIIAMADAALAEFNTPEQRRFVGRARP